MTDDLVQRLKSGCKNIQFCKIDACCCPVMEEAADRIEELEARLAGVDAGTHVIIPVEPTEKRLEHGGSVRGFEEWGSCNEVDGCAQADIRTAQEQDND